MTAVPDRSNLVSAWAPAKVNLYLHIGAPGAGGLHPVDSFVVFADNRVADRISARTWPQLTLEVEGANAKALKSAPNNLTLAAAMALRDACDRRGLGAALVLHKELPIAGGVGGGSADAAATLHILNKVWGIEFGEQALERLATQLGSDVPACVRSRPLVMRGTGERLYDVAAPSLPAVLVNPGAVLETRRVFERFDRLGANRNFRETDPPQSVEFSAFVSALQGYRNDLEGAAIGMCREIDTVLDILRAERGCMLARMSGSGPTCFGIFDTEDSADAAARQIAGRKKHWWVRPTTLRGAAEAV